MSYFRGEEQVLYLVIDGLDYPIGCVSEDSFSEQSDMLETTTLDNEGWKTSVPLNQSYNISFSGVEIISNQSSIEKYSFDLLTGLKRNRTKINWKILLDTEGNYKEQTGQGYITSLNNTSSVGNVLEFDGTIEGYGKPEISSYLGNFNNLVFEDGNNYVFEDSNNAKILN